MKLLLDANISWRISRELNRHYKTCSHVDKIGLKIPATDIQIWNFAKKNNYIT